jgi:phosphoribosyl 1,2-cyclic phosphodiesterase
MEQSSFYMEVNPAMPVQFAVLASGSRGNSTLVRDRVAGLLIDVGIGAKELGQRLESVGASWSEIAAVALTHTHSDHVDSSSFAELARRGIVVYCHEGHRQELIDNAGFQKLEAAALVRQYDDMPFMTTTGMRLEPIRLRHDDRPTFGFRVEASAARRRPPVKIGYLADAGTWSDLIADSLIDVEVLAVEFNHDVALERSSGRPAFLVRRNLGDDGHLSNSQGAGLVSAVLERSRRKAMRHLVLLHLSEQCNRPELALSAARDAVRPHRHNVQIHDARQSPAHPNLWVDCGHWYSPTAPLSVETSEQARARAKSPPRRTLAVGLRLLDLIDHDDNPCDNTRRV